MLNTEPISMLLCTLFEHSMIAPVLLMSVEAVSKIFLILHDNQCEN